MEIEVTSASVVVTDTGTTAPFSAISGASSLTLSDASAVLPYSALIVSASVFCLNASSGYLSLAAARAPLTNGILPRPTRATAPAPCRISLRVAENRVSVLFIQSLLTPALARHGFASQCLKEIHHGADLLFGQDPVSSERRHHGQRIAKGFV